MPVTVRPAKPGDGEPVAAIRVASSRATYRGIFSDNYLVNMDMNLDTWRSMAAGQLPGTELFVCEGDEGLLGFACCGPARPPAFAFAGELYAMYVAPHAIGKGCGSMLMPAVIKSLVKAGCADMFLWVLEDNVRARRFYAKHGGVEVPNSRQSFTSDGVEIWEVAYGFHPLPQAVARG